MAKIDTSKLLPPKSTGSSLIAAPKKSLIIQEKKTNISSSLKPIDQKSFSLSKDVLKNKSVKDAEDVNNKLVKIEKLFKNELLVSKKKAETKRKEKEKQDFEAAEKRLELPKINGFKLPGINLPSLGFFDRVKRFLFFTTLGWLLPKILEFLPKLEKFANIISGVYNFAEDIFGKLFDGFMSLVKFGGDLKDKTIGFIASLKAGPSGNFQKEFDNLEKQFNNFVNLSIIAGVLSADIGLSAVDEYNKWRKKNAEPGKPKSGEPSKPAVKAGAKVTQGRGGKPRLGKSAKVTTGKGKVPGWWNRIFKGPLAKLKGPLSKFAGVAVPGLGAVVGAADAAARFNAGDKLGGTLASLSATLDALTAGSAILAITGIGAAVPAFFGTLSMSIDVFLLIRDILKSFNVPMFSKGGKIVGKYQGGGRAGKRPSNKPVRRTFTPAKRKPFKIKPPKTQPGKDVGGKKKIIKFYGKKVKPGDPEYYQRPSGGWLSRIDVYNTKNSPEEKIDETPFKAIESTAKILKEVPLIGGIMGAAVDVTLGQKPDRKIYQSLSSGIGYLVESLANQKINTNISSLMNDIKGFADGGYIPPSRQLKSIYNNISSDDLIAKVLGPTIEQRVNEAIQNIQKKLREIESKEKEKPGLRPEESETPSGGPMVESVDISGLSKEDIDALGKMIAAESAGESDLGKASVMNVILNRYRLAKSGKGYLPKGKTRDNVTIRDILYAPNQFSPIADGSFARTSSNSGKSALAKAISAGGNDPQKLKKKLMDSGLSEKDADYIVVSTAFSNPEARSSRPFNTREVDVGRHTFQESPYARLKAPGQKFDANINMLEFDAKVDPGKFKPVSGTSGRSQGNIPLKVSYSPFTSDKGNPKISSAKGWRWGREHTGLDIEADEGTPMYAYLPGVITFSGNAGNYGYRVEWKDEKGNIHSYSHLQKDPGFKKGQKIDQGQLIGLVGKTGRSTGPHLHWEIQNSSGQYQNPVNWTKSNPLPKPIVSKLSIKNGKEGIIENGKWKPKAWTEDERKRYKESKEKKTFAKLTPIQLNNLQKRTESIKIGDKPIIIPGVGSIQMGRNLFGIPQKKYFNREGTEITQDQFNDLVEKYKIHQKFKEDSQNLQKGGQISLLKPNRSIPNSFASYENYGTGPMMIIQPIQTIIEKTVPVRSKENSVITFPIIVGVNNSDLANYRG